MPRLSFPFDNTYARELTGFYAACAPAPAAEPTLLFFNHGLARELGLDLDDVTAATLADTFSGNHLPAEATPIAQAYAGHQFGQFSPQLGDGRALLIGELIDRHGQRRDVAFKGSGQTPFSRRGDGKAAVGPMLREVLIGEAMHALGIPTTRALAVVGSGEAVYRERPLPGAILTRVAQSHLRVGTFQFFAAHGSDTDLKKLADYTIARHDAGLLSGHAPYTHFLAAVAERQAALVAQWMHVGFIHGVMNTDNMSLAGETIDYGPCAFMEAYTPRAVFSSIDEAGRYAYREQPRIARWNLARFAETLLPLLDADEKQAIALATAIVNAFPEHYQQHWLAGLRAKLGLTSATPELSAADQTLGEDWLAMLHRQAVDYTLAWRRLCEAAEGRDAALLALFADHTELGAWLVRWRARCAAEDGPAPGAGQARGARMRQVNPWIIPRNQRVEEALDAAQEHGDLGPFETLLQAIRKPYDEDPACAHLAAPATPQFAAGFQTFCGT